MEGSAQEYLWDSEEESNNKNLDSLEGFFSGFLTTKSEGMWVFILDWNIAVFPF